MSTRAAFPESHDHLLGLVEWLGAETRHALHHVTGFLHLLAEEPLTPAQMQYLSRSTTSLEELLRKANMVADLAAAESADPAWTRTRLAVELRAMFAWMTSLCGRSGTAFEGHTEELPEWVQTDLPLLESALYRVAARRLQWSPDGISVVTRWREGMLECVMADTGRPIPSAELHAEPGVRDAAWLHIARILLSRAGGGVEVVSNAFGAVAICLRLPARLAEEPDVSVASESQATQGGDAATGDGPMSLLVAEDSDESFWLFEAYVREAGHSVVRAHNGAEAVELVTHGCFDLIVMDVHMPVMDGYRASRRIREWETEHGRPHVPIVLLSADSGQRLSRLGASAGCSGYLSKPANKADLLRALRHYRPQQSSNLAA